MVSNSLTESLRETLTLFDGTGAPQTTTEVAEQLDLGRRSTYERLERLVEHGELETKKVGASARVWWRSQTPSTIDEEASTHDWPAASGTLIDDVLDEAEVGVFVLDEDFRVEWINKATERYFGLDREAVLGRDKRQLVDEEIASMVADSTAFADTVLATYDDNTSTERFECRVTAGDGRDERWLEHRSKPIESGAFAGGRVELYYEVTDRKRSEQAQREEREKFESLVDAVEEYAIFTLDPDGYVQTWNTGAERIKGYETDEILGEHFSIFYTDEDRTAGMPEQNLAEAREAGVVEDQGWRVRADGSTFWANVTLTPIYEDGEIEGYAKVTQDMTERREYEQRLREEKAFVESILDNQRDVIYAYDTDGQLLRWNDRLREVTGYTDAELEEMKPVEFIADEAVEQIKDGIERVLEDGESLTVELPLEAADGTVTPYEYSATPMTNDEGAIIGFTGVARDVSERKAKEQRLQRQRDELKAELDEVFDRIDDGFFALDTDLRFTYINEYAVDVLDLSAGEVIGSYIWDVLEPGAVAPEILEDAVETQESRTFEEFYEPLDAWFESQVYASESGISVYFHNITERKEAEKALQQSQKRLGLALEAANMGTWELDLRTEASPVRSAQHDRIFGYEDPLDDWSFERFIEHVHPADRERIKDRFETAFETEEWAFECRIIRADDVERWIVVRGELFYEDGEVSRAVGIVQDITERKERERKLEESRQRYQTLVDNFPNGMVALFNEDMEYTLAGGNLFEQIGFELDDIEGETVGVAVDDPEARDRLVAQYRRALAGETQTFEIEWNGKIISMTVSPVTNTEGDVFAGMVMSQNITERKERERELEEYRRRYQTVMENFPNGAVGLVNEELRYDSFGGTPEGATDVTRADLEGGYLPDVLPAQLADVVVPHYEAALDGETATFEATVGDRDYQFHFGPVRDDDGEIFAAMGMSQDITARKDYERHLKEAKSQLEAATEAGAIGTFEWHIPEDEMVTGPSFATQFDVDPDAAREGVSLDQFISSIHEDDRERVKREIDAAVESCGEYKAEYRVWNADDEVRWVVARGQVECDDDGNPITFPGALTDITERKRAEIELDKHRQQLEALNGINEVVRNITSAVIEQSTREEIEATVCERLAETDSYLFAWIGDVDASSQTVNLRTEAGVDGYLDGVTITVEPDDERSGGPTGRAIRTGETQITNDITVESRHDPWREHIEQYGFRSSAAIPIVHADTIYGVLNLYADRPYAFQGAERTVISQLGEVVGHAIAATERKQALMSDELVELDFQIQDIFSTVDHPVETGGTITLDHVVPVTDGEFLVYGTVTPDAVEAVNGLVEVLPHWESVTVHSEGDPASFELRLSDPPVLSVVAAHGGYLDRAVIGDGDYRMSLHLAPNVDVRRIIDVVEETYPQAEMLRRRQITRSHDDPNRVQRRIFADLTDRQRAVLEAAYHAGFFEWPRDTSGEEVAESLDVSSPTFHQHLRKAEGKVFDTLLSGSVPTPG